MYSFVCFFIILFVFLPERFIYYKSINYFTKVSRFTNYEYSLSSSLLVRRKPQIWIYWSLLRRILATEFRREVLHFFSRSFGSRQWQATGSYGRTPLNQPFGDWWRQSRKNPEKITEYALISYCFIWACQTRGKWINIYDIVAAVQFGFMKIKQ